MNPNLNHAVVVCNSQADASTAEELGIALDEEGNVVAGDHEQANDEGDENDDGMPNEPDQALFFLQGKVLTSWEHSKVMHAISSRVVPLFLFEFI